MPESHALAVLPPAPAEGLVLDTFKPSVRDRRYLAAWAEVLDTGQKPSSANLARVMGLGGKNPEKALAKWRERNPETEAWVNRQLEAMVEQYRPKVLSKFARLALLGSVPHAEFLAKVGGWYKQADPTQGGAGAPVNNGFIVHIHGGGS